MNSRKQWLNEGARNEKLEATKLFIQADIYAAVNIQNDMSQRNEFYTQKFIYVCSNNFVQDVLKKKRKKNDTSKDLMSEIRFNIFYDQFKFLTLISNKFYRYNICIIDNRVLSLKIFFSWHDNHLVGLGLLIHEVCFSRSDTTRNHSR